MKKQILNPLVLIVGLLLATSAMGSPVATEQKKNSVNNYPNTIIIQWNDIAHKTLLQHKPFYHTNLAARIQAMVHIAMHDALNSIDPVYETYALQRVDKEAHPIAAASAAAHAVLVASFPDQKVRLDSAFNALLRDVKAGNSRERGLKLGAEAADAILALRNGDGAFADPIGQINNPEKPGLYQPVPPMPFMFAPTWHKMKTFAINSPDQFRTPAMPALSSNEYAVAFNEVKSKGSKNSTTRTAEETAIAKFWYEFSEIGWNRVTKVAVQNANLDLLTTARLFALVNMGLADGYTAGWDSKIYHNFWRPYTAIRKATTDGNDATIDDAAWEPLMNTPPVQDYPSTHSVLGSAAATILTGILGANTGFTMTSTTAEPAEYTRSFKTFQDAAVENGDSRVFAGIHFRFSCDRGFEQGKKIGDWILIHQLKKRSGKSI